MLEPKTGVIPIDRPKVKYVSPKSDESQELLIRVAKGEAWRKKWLEKRIRGDNNG